LEVLGNVGWWCFGLDWVVVYRSLLFFFLGLGVVVPPKI
jgi:hypothetical protein